jgi:hypothetical protein
MCYSENVQLVCISTNISCISLHSYADIVTNVLNLYNIHTKSTLCSPKMRWKCTRSTLSCLQTTDGLPGSCTGRFYPPIRAFNNDYLWKYLQLKCHFRWKYHTCINYLWGNDFPCFMEMDFQWYIFFSQTMDLHLQWFLFFSSLDSVLHNHIHLNTFRYIFVTFQPVTI